jgi:hypothetical protein
MLFIAAMHSFLHTSCLAIVPYFTSVYEAKTMSLVIGILPKVFAADTIKAREFLWKKYQDYFAQGRHHEG